MRINETFFSIQGESTYAGWPCFFIRTTGCPLRCRWCDTEYAFYEGTDRVVEDLLAEAAHSPTALVEVTGGEPFVAPELPVLVSGLLDLGKTVLIETSGAFPPPAGLDRRSHIIMDIKPPGSAMHHTMREEIFQTLGPGDEIKAVLTGREDFDWTMDFIDRIGVASSIPVTVSPVFGECRPEELAQWVLDSGRKLRVQVQLHKILFDPKRRGV